MFLSRTFTKCLLNLSDNLGKNFIIRSGIVACTLFLIHQCNIYQRHQRNDMITLTSLISLGVSVITFGDEFRRRTIILFIFSIDDDFYVFVVDVQSDM